ncbi:hypothetical protein Sjap_002543 [Stephania japonica]|uniref:Uncharacterized protein n=1 Tax=Stephania japonica TaxID=461633 RepID=A0AAP0PSM5_9MAGN
MGEDVEGRRLEVEHQRLVVDVGRRSPRNRGKSRDERGRECNANGGERGRERHGRRGRGRERHEIKGAGKERRDEGE